MTSVGQETALNLSLIECRKECTDTLAVTTDLIHLLAAAEAELALQVPLLVYFGNKQLEFELSFACCAAHSAMPLNGTIRSLPVFFKRRYALGAITMHGTS